MQIICLLLSLYTLAIFGVIILSWFPSSEGSPVASIYGFLRRITDPVLEPVRRLMPSAGVGGMRLDLSPMIVLILIQVLRSFIC